MQLLETYKGFDIELNPHGLIIASQGAFTFPMVCNSIEHARKRIDARVNGTEYSTIADMVVDHISKR